jgi:hypothetical protein
MTLLSRVVLNSICVLSNEFEFYINYYKNLLKYISNILLLMLQQIFILIPLKIIIEVNSNQKIHLNSLEYHCKWQHLHTLIRMTCTCPTLTVCDITTCFLHLNNPHFYQS